MTLGFFGMIMIDELIDHLTAKKQAPSQYQ